MKHYTVLIHNQSNTETLIKGILNNTFKKFSSLNGQTKRVFSAMELERFIDQEERHGIKILTSNTTQPLKSMSSGERKKALLNYILTDHPECLILVNPFDNLDVKSRSELKNKLTQIAETTILIQVVSRLSDILPLTTDFFSYLQSKLQYHVNKGLFLKKYKNAQINFDVAIPKPLQPIHLERTELVKFEDVSVSFEGKPVLKNINWTINKGEFWQLIGPNGSGKSTLLHMITGDSHKGYGQNLTLLGIKKGSGESVWDIKKHIGYFTPSMTDKFRGYHTLENMLISGLYDSVGLYIKPSDIEKQIAGQWLDIIGLIKKKNSYFHELSLGEKRLLMVARAMIKHPTLLILDEPTSGLDDTNTNLFLTLVNKIANETDSAIIFVSHRYEAELRPTHMYTLIMDKKGSFGKTIDATDS